MNRLALQAGVATVLMFALTVPTLADDTAVTNHEKTARWVLAKQIVDEAGLTENDDPYDRTFLGKIFEFTSKLIGVKENSNGPHEGPVGSIGIRG